MRQLRQIGFALGIQFTLMTFPFSVGAQCITPEILQRISDTARSSCLAGSQYELQADAQGFLLLRRGLPGVQISSRITQSEGQGGAFGYQNERIRLQADARILDCIGQRLPLMLEAVGVRLAPAPFELRQRDFTLQLDPPPRPIGHDREVDVVIHPDDPRADYGLPTGDVEVRDRRFVGNVIVDDPATIRTIRYGYYRQGNTSWSIDPPFRTASGGYRIKRGLQAAHNGSYASFAVIVRGRIEWRERRDSSIQICPGN